MKDVKFPFSDAPNTACFTCRHVLEENRPIRYVSHDEDGYWQFLCGGNHTEEDARVVSLVSVWEMDESVGELVGLDYGESAEAADPSGWLGDSSERKKYASKTTGYCAKRHGAVAGRPA